MRIDELTADQFMRSVCEITEAINVIRNSKAGKQFAKDLELFRKTTRKDENLNKKTGEWLLDELPKCIPSFCAECGDSVYSILAACDGITLEEYKESFTPRKLVQDVKQMCSWVSSNFEEASAFFK